MDPDTVFVIGAIIGVFSIPAIVSAFADGRTPRAPAIIILLSIMMISYAAIERPGAYTFETAPDVFTSVISRMIN